MGKQGDDDVSTVAYIIKLNEEGFQLLAKRKQLNWK